MVFVKEKVDEAEQVVPRALHDESRHGELDFNEEIEIGGGESGEKGEKGEKDNLNSKKKKNNKIFNESSATVGINLSHTNMDQSG